MPLRHRPAPLDGQVPPAIGARGCFVEEPPYPRVLLDGRATLRRACDIYFIELGGVLVRQVVLDLAGIVDAYCMEVGVLEDSKPHTTKVGKSEYTYQNFDGVPYGPPDATR